MKKFLLSLFLAGGIYQSFSQTNSVTLTPPVGSPVNYASITSAYAAIPASPGGNYLIEIQSSYNGTDASEVYPIQLTDKGLTSGGATITIRPAAGANGKIIQRPVAAAGVVMQMNGGDNIILDGRPGGVVSTASNYLTVNDAFAGSNTNRDIELLNGANNNIIRYVNATAADATVAGAGARVILISSGTSNNNNTVEYCVVTGGLRGIQDFGQSDALPNIGNFIRYNTVQNFGAIGIFAGSFQKNCTIEFNNVVMNNYNVLVGPASAGASVGITAIQQQATAADNVSNINDNTISLVTTSATVTSVTGITDIGTGTENINRNIITNLSAPLSSAPTNGNFLVGISLGTATGGGVATFNASRNKVSGLTSAGIVNIRGVSVFPLTGSTVNINNNFLSVTGANSNASAVFGFLFGNTSGYNYTTNDYYNTINLGGTATGTASSYGIFKSDANAGSVFNQKNNIVINSRTGGTGSHYGYYGSNTSGTLSMDYNTYYASTYAAYWNSIGYDNSSLAAYKAAAAPQEQNSTFANVTFVSATDLHITGASNGDNALRGTPIPGITTDIDGATRSALYPYRGADEASIALPIKLISFTGKIAGANSELNWKTINEVDNNYFNIERSFNGTSFSVVGKVSATNLAANNYLFIDKDVKQLGDKNVYYRLNQVSRDGRNSISNIVMLQLDAKQFGLNQNYPNPVKDLTTISYNLPSDSKVSLEVFTLDGRKVSVLQNTSQTAGFYTVQLNVKQVGLPAGNYTYRLTALDTNGTATTSTKMLIVQ